MSLYEYAGAHNRVLLHSLSHYARTVLAVQYDTVGYELVFVPPYSSTVQYLTNTVVDKNYLDGCEKKMKKITDQIQNAREPSFYSPLFWIPITITEQKAEQPFKFVGVLSFH